MVAFYTVLAESPKLPYKIQKSSLHHHLKKKNLIYESIKMSVFLCCSPGTHAASWSLPLPSTPPALRFLSKQFSHELQRGVNPQSPYWNLQDWSGFTPPQRNLNLQIFTVRTPTHFCLNIYAPNPWPAGQSCVFRCRCSKPDTPVTVFLHQYLLPTAHTQLS